MARTNSNMTGDGKAVDAHLRNQDRPEGADHLPLKNEPGEKGEDHTDDMEPIEEHDK